MILPLLVPAAAAAVLAYLLAPLVTRLAEAVGAMDRPSARKLHTTPVPRLGGLSVIVAVGLVWFAQSLVFEQWPLPREIAIGLGLGLLPIVVISLIDDIRSVRPAMKLLAHVGGAVFAVSWGISLGADVHLFGATISLGWAAVPLSVVWIVGVTNAFNLIDGLDGLSSGLALIAACSLAAVFLLVGQPAMVAATLVLAGALAGFLPYNLHPARLFLGDTGSAAIGFCLAALALRGGSTLSSGFAVLVPVFILGLPIADTLVAVARRGLRRLEHHRGGLFVADRNHIHHRLLALGVDHKRAVLILYGTGLLCASAAFASLLLSVREAALFTAALLLAGLVGIHRLRYSEFAFIRRGLFLRVVDAPIVHRAMFAVFADLAIVLVAVLATVTLKVDSSRLSAVLPLAIDLSSVLAPVAVIVFWACRMYQGDWRLVGLTDFVRVSRATAAVALVGLVGHSFLGSTSQPVSLFFIFWLVSFVLVVGSRASYLILLGLQRRSSTRGRATIVYGAGERGVAAVNELYRDHDLNLRPIAFIDDAMMKSGRRVNGLPVLGSIRDLEATVTRLGAEAVLIAISTLQSDRLRCVMEVCGRVGISVLRARSSFEPLKGVGLVDESTGQAPSSEHAVDWPVLTTQYSDPVTQGLDRSAMVQPGTPGLRCSSCGSSKVYRSRVRGRLEQMRKRFTHQRPYRCHDCDWRKWTAVVNESGVVPPRREGVTSPDFAVIEQLLDPTMVERRQLGPSH